ncbi:hypothetical protein GCM10011585_21920 [Edaphobacter dinghuensis]|uniref:Uncharacterized protein n=1 Tax=Edaphobacter dinghuensis TaxID=1560005 RepID=A0A917HH16_9BACT|nr:hypothetical protein GCM10011585_21920 [Edaphobacter dinghuensis]
MTKKMYTPVSPLKMAYQRGERWYGILCMVWSAMTRKIDRARKPSRLGIRDIDAARVGRGWDIVKRASVGANYIVTSLRKCFDLIRMQVYASRNWNKSSRNLGFQ